MADTEQRFEVGFVDERSDRPGIALTRTGTVEVVTPSGARIPFSGPDALVYGLSAYAYRLVSDGATVTAYDVDGAEVASGADGGAVLSAVLPGASTLGAVIEFRNDGHIFPWASVPQLPSGITGQLAIRGNGATIQLSSGGSRFLDFGRTADYQTFQHITIEDFVIDANNIAGALHVIVGGRTPAGATADQRVSHYDITIRNIRAYNIPVASNGRVGISIGCHHLGANEAQQTSSTKILIEHVTVEGGCGGISVTAGTNPFNAASAVNHYIDDVRIIGCSHSCLSSRASGIFLGIQIGQNGFGGSVTVRDFISVYSGDVGVEIDGMTYALVENAEIWNATNAAFLSTNFRAPDKPAIQTYEYRNCRSIVTDAAHGPPKGWSLKANNSIALGTIRIIGCRNERTTAAVNQGDAVDCENPLNITRLVVDGFRSNLEGLSAASGNMSPFMFGGLVAADRVLLKDIVVKIRGAKSGAGSLALEAFRFAGSGPTGYSALTVAEDIDVDILVTGYGGGVFTTNAVQMGVGGINSMYGHWRRLKIISLGDDTGAQGFNFGNATNLVIQTAAGGPAFISIEDCDFSGITQSREFRFLSVPQNQDKVFLRGIRWRLQPRASAAMSSSNFAAATFTSTEANQYVGGASAEIHFAGGSGAGITKIEASKDGSTYESVWTQSSGAMSQDVLVPVDNGDYIKVTFATTQPTTRVRFRH